jgi:hypothetical protein
MMRLAKEKHSGLLRVFMNCGCNKFYDIDCQINTGEASSSSCEYATDTGLIVPAITLALRDRLMAAAEARGFSRERITELASLMFT